MPGLIGLLSKRSHVINEQKLFIMLKTMARESFYSNGTYKNDHLGVYAGWVCHTDSFCDCLPVWNEKKNIALIFFGENFANQELLDQIKAKHHQFESTNANYLIHLYEEKGIDFLQDLNGWFSGLIVDLQANKIVLFNDRFGMQRIYYHEGKDVFYFASEAKALLTVCPELRELDTTGLGEFITCGCTLEKHTLFKNISTLPAASSWTFQNDTVHKTNYFLPSSWENQPLLDEELLYDKLKETYIRLLPRYFQANQKIGISLTGGLDTRMIMGNIQMQRGEYPCYTFGGMYRDSYDVKISRKVATACKQTHQVVRLAKDFLSDFPTYAENAVYISDGGIGVSGSPEVYVNKLAREIAPIRITGNYGSELMRGIINLKASLPNTYLFNADFLKYFDNSRKTLNKYKGKNPITFLLFKEAPWSYYNRLAIEQSYLTIRTPYMDNDLVKLMYQAPQSVRNRSERSVRLIMDGNPVLGNIMTDRGLLGNLKYPLANIAESYYIFLTNAEYAYNYGMPQWLAKFDYVFKFMHFDKLFLGRHKFYHFRVWYRDQLADYVKAILLDYRTLSRPYLNRKFVEQIVEGHTKGYRNHTTEITQLLTLELIQRLLIENK